MRSIPSLPALLCASLTLVWLTAPVNRANAAYPGTVIFRNSSTSLALTNSYPTNGPTEPVAGRYYFGLFSAPAGATDPNAFVFTGVYATNVNTAGAYRGEAVSVVPGWTAGQTYAILTRGWSADLGHYWPAIEAQWTSGMWVGPGFFGTSEIRTIQAGGFDGEFTFPSSPTYNPLLLQFVIDPPPIRLEAVGPTSTGFRLRIKTLYMTGGPFTRHLWSSTNAVEWTPLDWIQITSEEQDYLDTNSPAPQRFYRLMP